LSVFIAVHFVGASCFTRHKSWRSLRPLRETNRCNVSKQITVQEQTYDYIVIGSGFGGSVSAMRLAEKGYSVLVLEKAATGTCASTSGPRCCAVLDFSK
jgi:hypothetical protein